MASVYGIIKGHAGYIDVESEKGRGTTFRLYLPGTQKRIEYTEKRPDPIQKGNETILLIDDEDLVLEVGQKFLTFMGYRVLTARDSEEAIEVYRSHREKIDLVILDLVMPKMEGGEVFKRLKQISTDVKVLVASGYGIAGKASQILEQGACGFIQKPYDMRELSKSIRSILSQ